MDKIFHPVSGETGFFCTVAEKELIDAVLVDFKSQYVTHETLTICGSGDQ